MPGDQISVLTIENDPHAVAVIRDSLTETDGLLPVLTLECATRLSTGLRRLSEQDFDVVLLELALPDSKGLETFVKVHSHAPGIPIVVLAELDDEALAVKAVHEGAQDYLVKGRVDSRLLRRSIRYAIERKQAEELICAQRDLGVALSAAPGLDETLRLCLESAIRVSKMDCGGVYLVDETSGEIDLVFHTGLPPDFVESGSHYSADSENARLIAEGKPIYMRREKLGVLLPEVGRCEALHAVAIVPMHHEGRAIGCLNLSSHTVEDVPRFARAALEAIAAQIGEAIVSAKAEKAVSSSEQKFRQLFDEAPIGYHQIDTQGRITRVNRTELDMLGYTAEEMLGRLIWEFVMDEEATRQAVAAKMAGEEPPGKAFERTYRRKDGTTLQVLIEDHLIADEGGKIAGIRSTIQDITERKRIEEALRDSEQMYRTLMKASPDAVTVTDLQGQITEASERALALYGFERPEDLVGKSTFDLIAPEERKKAMTNLRKTLKEGFIANAEYTWFRRDGTRFIGELNAALIRDAHGEPKAIISIARDITQRKQTEEDLRALTLTDELTGLHNRRGFFALAEQQLKIAARMKTDAVLVFADLDGIKWINDTFGHSEGDRALRRTADALKETFRDSDVIARMGGDEFVILAIETPENMSETITTRLQKNLRNDNAKGNHRYKLSLSFGMARYDPDSPISIDELLWRADALMYEHKRSKQES